MPILVLLAGFSACTTRNFGIFFYLEVSKEMTLADERELSLDHFIGNDGQKVYLAIFSAYLAPHDTLARFTQFGKLLKCK